MQSARASPSLWVQVALACAPVERSGSSEGSDEKAMEPQGRCRGSNKERGRGISRSSKVRISEGTPYNRRFERGWKEREKAYKVGASKTALERELNTHAQKRTFEGGLKEGEYMRKGIKREGEGQVSLLTTGVVVLSDALHACFSATSAPFCAPLSDERLELLSSKIASGYALLTDELHDLRCVRDAARAAKLRRRVDDGHEPTEKEAVFLARAAASEYQAKMRNLRSEIAQSQEEMADDLMRASVRPQCARLASAQRHCGLRGGVGLNATASKRRPASAAAK
eukprot:2005612-Pleurochrysis_carterae.AAC.2